MDIFHIYLLQKLSRLLEKTKINEEEAGDGPLKKQFKRTPQSVPIVELVNYYSADET